MRKARLKIYKEFSVGVSVALFASGIINIFLGDGFSSKSMIFSLTMMILSWFFLRSAIQYETWTGK